MVKFTREEFHRIIDKYNIHVSSCRSLNVENDDKNSSVKLLDLEVLDCPICYDTLTTPIFQCYNGHIACSTCCNKLNNKCPSCGFSIGHIRCRAMERVIESFIVPKKSPYEEELTHEKESDPSSLCSCPSLNCNYTGSYKDLYSHFGIHMDEGRCNRFLLGESAGIYLEIYFELTTKYTSVVMKEYEAGLLFVVQFFSEQPHGVYVTMSCIAPCALEVGEFSCHISTVVGKYNMAIKLTKVKRVRRLSLETPEEDFMLVPSYFLRGSHSLKLTICVRKLKQEQ